MNKFEITKITDKKYFLTMIQGDEDFMVSNGITFEKQELYELYLILRDIFSTEK
jgi:hypothetical protein